MKRCVNIQLSEKAALWNKGAFTEFMLCVSIMPHCTYFKIQPDSKELNTNNISPHFVSERT